MKLVVVTGLSGSGKSIALHTLEDCGFYCIDNLPLSLLQALGDELATQRAPHFATTAVGIDARNRQSALLELPALLQGLKGRGIGVEMLYLEADDQVLIQRYSETRRRHPLSSEQIALEEAIRRERQMLESYRSSADLVIDTSHTNQHQLRDMLRERLQLHTDHSISILLESFGYKHGVPRDADFVYDVRCLPNPHWNRELRQLTGRDPEVRQFLENDPRVIAYRDELIAFFTTWIPRFAADGRSYLTIALGCTGGQHRSVYMVERLTNHFRDCGIPVIKRHRELP